MNSWATYGPAVSAAFFASLVEVVEAFTIVLAVGTTCGWRPALTGTGAGLAVLALIVLLLGPLLDQIPIKDGAARLAPLTRLFVAWSPMGGGKIARSVQKGAVQPHPSSTASRLGQAMLGLGLLAGPGERMPAVKARPVLRRP